MAAVSGQLALLAHDVAHRQVFRTRRPAEMAGRLIGNLGDRDELRLVAGQAHPPPRQPQPRGARPGRGARPAGLVDGAGRGARQDAPGSPGSSRLPGVLFFPLLTLEALNLHVSSIRALLRPGLRERRLEAALLAAHCSATSALLLLALPLGQGARCSSSCTRRCSASTSAAPSRPTTRACRPAPATGARLPAQAGADLAQRARRAVDRRRAGRAELPDRAPPLPEHAVRRTCARRSRSSASSARSAASTTRRPGWSASYRIALRHLHAVGAPLRANA